MLSKSLIQFSVEGQGFVSSLLFDLRPNYGGGNEDNGGLLQKHPLLHSVPPALQQVTTDPRLCQRLLDTHGKSGSVSCGVTALLSWSWHAEGFVCALQESVSPVLCKSWQLYGGLMATSSKRAYATPRSTAPRAPAPAAFYCWPVPPQKTP